MEKLSLDIDALPMLNVNIAGIVSDNNHFGAWAFDVRPYRSSVSRVVSAISYIDVSPSSFCLRAMIEAVSYPRRPAHITVYTDSLYIASYELIKNILSHEIVPPPCFHRDSLIWPLDAGLWSRFYKAESKHIVKIVYNRASLPEYQDNLRRFDGLMSRLSEVLKN